MTANMSVKLLLFVSAAVAAAVGAALLIAPKAFQASAGIALGDDPSLLSEIRAPGGALLVLGVLMALGAVIDRWRDSAVVLCASLYLAYGTARLLSIALDGAPTASILAATAIELAIGLAAAGVLWRRSASASDNDATVARGRGV